MILTHWSWFAGVRYLVTISIFYLSMDAAKCQRSDFSQSIKLYGHVTQVRQLESDRAFKTRINKTSRGMNYDAESSQ